MMKMEATLIMDVTTVVDEHSAPSQEPGDQRDSRKDEQGGEIRAWIESCDIEEYGDAIKLPNARLRSRRLTRLPACKPFSNGMLTSRTMTSGLKCGGAFSKEPAHHWRYPPIRALAPGGSRTPPPGKYGHQASELVDACPAYFPSPLSPSRLQTSGNQD